MESEDSDLEVRCSSKRKRKLEINMDMESDSGEEDSGQESEDLDSDEEFSEDESSASDDDDGDDDEEEQEDDGSDFEDDEDDSDDDSDYEEDEDSVGQRTLSQSLIDVEDEDDEEKAMLLSAVDEVESQDYSQLDDSCAICLADFEGQTIGNPSECRHIFCLPCIQEWAKNINTCPVDRTKFRKILVKDSKQGSVTEEIYVEDRNLTDGMEEDTDPTYCEVCSSSGQEDRLLLCDGCDHGYHLDCLDPPLSSVPVDEWFCPECPQQENHTANETIENGASQTAARQRTSRPQQRGRGRGRGARSVATRRESRQESAIREVIASLLGYRPSRGATARRGRANSRNTSSRSATKSRGRGGKRSTSRRKTRKGKGKGRKRKTTAKTKTEGAAGSRSTSRRRKRRKTTKKRGKKAKNKKTTSKSKEASNNSTDLGRVMGRCPVPASSFSLFGNPFDLNDFHGDPDEENTEPLTTVHSVPKPQRENSNSSDVLGSILNELDDLDSECAEIHRDGTIIPKMSEKKTKKRRRVMLHSDDSDSNETAEGEDGMDINDGNAIYMNGVQPHDQGRTLGLSFPGRSSTNANVNGCRPIFGSISRRPGFSGSSSSTVDIKSWKTLVSSKEICTPKAASVRGEFTNFRIPKVKKGNETMLRPSETLSKKEHSFSDRIAGGKLSFNRELPPAPQIATVGIHSEALPTASETSARSSAESGLPVVSIARESISSMSSSGADSTFRRRAVTADTTGVSLSGDVVEGNQTSGSDSLWASNDVLGSIYRAEEVSVAVSIEDHHDQNTSGVQTLSCSNPPQVIVLSKPICSYRRLPLSTTDSVQVVMSHGRESLIGTKEKQIVHNPKDPDHYRPVGLSRTSGIGFRRGKRIRRSSLRGSHEEAHVQGEIVEPRVNVNDKSRTSEIASHRDVQASACENSKASMHSSHNTGTESISKSETSRLDSQRQINRNLAIIKMLQQQSEEMKAQLISVPCSVTKTAKPQVSQEFTNAKMTAASLSQSTHVHSTGLAFSRKLDNHVVTGRTDSKAGNVTSRSEDVSARLVLKETTSRCNTELGTFDVTGSTSTKHLSSRPSRQPDNQMTVSKTFSAGKQPMKNISLEPRDAQETSTDREKIQMRVSDNVKDFKPRSCNTLPQISTGSQVVNSGIKTTELHGSQGSQSVVKSCQGEQMSSCSPEGNRSPLSNGVRVKQETQKEQRTKGIERLQRVNRIVDEVKLALKAHYMIGDINKEEYKTILRKGVNKISDSGRSVERKRVESLIRKYVDKYKQARVGDITKGK